ncbi:MAG: cation transporting ATPase C-terminal domain-containing protein, partial [Pseudothermotoga sp.]|nr:cation transporting ATPase C-terminal domain-containing protein [Pseudothermotoga sp.]
YLPGLQDVFGTNTLAGHQLLVSSLAAFMIVPLFELVKWFDRRKS